MSENLYPPQPVLLVDDEEQLLLSAEFTLSSNGINNILQCRDSREVLSLLAEQEVSTIVLDMYMPHIPGWEILPTIISDFPAVPVIILTAMNEVNMAVESMKRGAFDYIVKPVDDERLVGTVRKAIELNHIKSENRRLREYLLTDKLSHPEAFSHIITENSQMRSIFQYCEAIASSPQPVLVTGETGVGKELVAEALHKLSQRSGEFVPVNVAGVDDQLFSDTLFGHTKGAYTGADRDRKGMIEQANDGTLFLDEIGDLAMESQVKLLRLLQERKYYPIGSDVPRTCDCRVVVATNCDLKERQNSGKFRKDLYYRLQTHHIHIPPLQERKEDIPPLIDHFIEKSARILNKKPPTPPRQLYTLLQSYSFPGNIRELEGMIFDAVSRHQSGVLSMESFRAKITPDEERFSRETGEGIGVSAVGAYSEIKFPDPLPTLKATEQKLIDEALRRANGNQTIAAQLLGISRRALNNRLSRAKQHREES